MRRALRLLLLLCLGFGAAQAQSPAPTPADAIPPVLRDWRGWVLKSQEFRACPLISAHDANEADSYICAWPGRLGLDADAAGLRFVQQWRVDAPSWIGLPGDADNWPQEVQVDGQAAAVLENAKASRKCAWDRACTASKGAFPGCSARSSCRCHRPLR